MKSRLIFLLLAVLFISLGTMHDAFASSQSSESITLSPGWNIVSTPKVLASHSFSAPENSTNFDIYVLDASETNGWATMADMGQTEFTPLYGYFVNNKTGGDQLLTLNYKDALTPDEKLFDRTFTTPGWYSIGIANPTYGLDIDHSRVDTDNPSKILNLLDGKYDLAIDFTDAEYVANKKSVALADPWKAVLPQDINTLNDFRETKGYALYIKDAGAQYSGLQTDSASGSSTSGIGKISLTISSEDPDATVLALETESNSDFMTVFAFDLDSSDSTDDITVSSIAIDVDVSSGSYNDIINDAKLIIDGDEYDDVGVTNGDTNKATLDFNTADLGINARDRITAELQLEFKALPSDREGMTIQASVGSSGIEATGSDNLTIEGSVFGEEHMLRTRGAILELTSTSESTKANASDDVSDDQGVFTLKFDVTAFENDLWVNKTAASGTTMGTAGVNFLVQDNTGTQVAAGTSTASLTSTADTDGTRFKVNEGETETFTLTVNYDPTTAGSFFQVQLYSLNFATSNADPSTQQKATPAADYQTDQISI